MLKELNSLVCSVELEGVNLDPTMLYKFMSSNVVNKFDVHICTIILRCIIIVCYTFLYYGHHGRGRMVVRFTTTSAISDYHH